MPFGKHDKAWQYVGQWTGSFMTDCSPSIPVEFKVRATVAFIDQLAWLFQEGRWRLPGDIELVALRSAAELYTLLTKLLSGLWDGTMPPEVLLLLGQFKYHTDVIVRAQREKAADALRRAL